MLRQRGWSGFRGDERKHPVARMSLKRVYAPLRRAKADTLVPGFR
jgi:hypothetical protein